MGSKILVCSRPAIGKTTFLLNRYIELTNDDNQQGIFFSLEHTKKMIVSKLSKKITSSKIKVYDKYNSFNDIVTKLKKLKNKNIKIDFIMCDYLQLFTTKNIKKLAEYVNINQIDCYISSHLCKSADLKDSPNIEDIREQEILSYFNEIYFLYKTNNNLKPTLYQTSTNMHSDGFELEEEYCKIWEKIRNKKVDEIYKLTEDVISLLENHIDYRLLFHKDYQDIQNLFQKIKQKNFFYMSNSAKEIITLANPKFKEVYKKRECVRKLRFIGNDSKILLKPNKIYTSTHFNGATYIIIDNGKEHTTGRNYFDKV